MNVPPKFVLCRLCLDYESVLLDPFKDDDVLDFQLSVVIQELLNFKVTKEDLIPWMVCANCVEKLRDFRDYKTKAIKNNKILDLLLSGNEKHIGKRLEEERGWPSLETYKMLKDSVDVAKRTGKGTPLALEPIKPEQSEFGAVAQDELTVDVTAPQETGLQSKDDGAPCHIPTPQEEPKGNHGFRQVRCSGGQLTVDYFVVEGGEAVRGRREGRGGALAMKKTPDRPKKSPVRAKDDTGDGEVSGSWEDEDCLGVEADTGSDELWRMEQEQPPSGTEEYGSYQGLQRRGGFAFSRPREEGYKQNVEYLSKRGGVGRYAAQFAALPDEGERWRGGYHKYRQTSSRAGMRDFPRHRWSSRQRHWEEEEVHWRDRIRPKLSYHHTADDNGA